MHAHKCEFCFKNGKTVIWAHGEKCAGNLEAHKCPVCGNVQWRKYMIAIAELPQARRQQQSMAVGIVSAIVELLATVAIAYGVSLLIMEVYSFVQSMKGETQQKKVSAKAKK